MISNLLSEYISDISQRLNTYRQQPSFDQISDNFENNCRILFGENPISVLQKPEEDNESFLSSINDHLYLEKNNKPKLFEDNDVIFMEDSNSKNNEDYLIKPLDKNKEVEFDSFPFTKGEGLGNVFKKFGLEFIWDENNKRFILSVTKNPIFTIKKIGKIRKNQSDNIKKKIKAKFHKELRKVINKELDKVNSKKLFECFSQDFIKNISIEPNKQIMEQTYEEIIRQDGFNDNKTKENILYNERYEKNLEVLKYLEANPDISEKSGFEIIKTMKYEDILKAYFSSAEFEKSLVDMHNKKNEKFDYIEKYVNESLSYIHFFKNQNGKNKKI